jgi:hypothetical protein
MSREFSQKILAIPVASAPATIEEPFTGFDEFHSDIAVDPGCDEIVQSGNSYYKFDLKITQRNLDTSVLDKYRNRRPAILILFDTDQNWFQVGNSETPVRAIVNPVKLSTEIKFGATLINSPF